MNAVDIILIVCFVPALVPGLLKGFIRQAMGLVAVVVGIWFSWNFSKVLSEWLLQYFDISPTYMDVIAFIVVLALVIWLLSLVGNLFEKILQVAMLGWLDKLLGLVFAFVKTAIIVGVLIVLFHALNMKVHLVKPEVLDGSVLYTGLKDLIYQIFPFFKKLLLQN